MTTVTIPPLSNAELEWVSGQMPQLAPLIANQRLTRLLRVPFILVLAWKVFPASTPSEVVSDIDERRFKDIVWRDFVERTAQKQGGLPKARPTFAALCDTVDALRGTYLIDQADALTHWHHEELADTLTDSYKRGGGSRCLREQDNSGVTASNL